MGLNDDIRRDALEILETLETQRHSDKVNTLINLLEKYAYKNKATHLMDSHDLQAILSIAKGKMANDSFPKFLKSGSITKQVSQSETPNLCIIEATIGYVNKLECLKRLPKFDYRDNKF